MADTDAPRLWTLAEMWDVYAATIPKNASEQQVRMLKDAWHCGADQFYTGFMLAVGSAAVDDADRDAAGQQWIDNVRAELHDYARQMIARQKIITPRDWRGHRN